MSENNKEDEYLKRTIQILFEEGDYFVSAQKLFLLLQEEIDNETFDFERFVLMISENPDNFQILDIPIQNADIKELAEEIYENGTFGGPFISAAHKEFTESEYADFMKLYIDSMLISLEHIYQAKLAKDGPNSDSVDKTEGLLQRAYEIKHKLDEIKL